MANRATCTLKSIIKWGLCIAGAGVLALTLAVVIYIHSGSSAVESWVGSQLLRIGGSYFAPEIKFDRLTYLRPRTIVLDNMTLSSPDPANAGHSVVILAVKRARLELSEIPKVGQPIRFSEVSLESPEIRAVANSADGGGVLGFSHLMKSSSEVAAKPIAPSPTTAAEGPPMKVSDWLLIRHIEIKDGKISYDPRVAGEPVFWLDGINAGLDFSPADNSTPGLYSLNTTISRKPAFNLGLKGQINIDTLDANLDKLDLTLDLQEKNTHFLPSELQKILQTYEVSGQIHAMAAGKLPLAHWQRSELTGTMDVTAARVAAGANRITVDSWICQAKMADGVAVLEKSDVKLLGGELHFTGTIPLEGQQQASVRLVASDLKIQQLLRTANPDDKPVYAGRFDADIHFAAPLAAWNQRAAGGGTFSVRDGKIGNIPVLSQILGVVGKSLKIIWQGGRDMSDSAEGSLSFAGDRLRIDRFDGKSEAVALRASGTIGFDGKLELRLNAGPMEKLQNSLGVLGQAWATLSDAVAGYRVSGTLSDPSVSVELGKGR